MNALEATARWYVEVRSLNVLLWDATRLLYCIFVVTLVGEEVDRFAVCTLGVIGRVDVEESRLRIYMKGNALISWGAGQRYPQWIVLEKLRLPTTEGILHLSYSLKQARS